MTMLFHFNYSEKENKISKEDKKTIRTYGEVLATNDNSFNGDGNFNQEDLIRNSGTIFAVIVEKTDSDSYNKHENAHFEVQEVFLTREKAVLLNNIIKLYNEFRMNLDYSRDGSEKILIQNFINTLKNVYGIDSHLEDVVKLVPYRDESDKVKTFRPDWHQFGTSEYDIFVLQKEVLNYEETVGSKSIYDNVKFRYNYRLI